MNKNNKIEKIFCEVMELKNIPKNFDKMKIGDITQWDSLANMNLLMALEKMEGSSKSVVTQNLGHLKLLWAETGAVRIV